MLCAQYSPHVRLSKIPIGIENMFYYKKHGVAAYGELYRITISDYLILIKIFIFHLKTCQFCFDTFNSLQFMHAVYKLNR